jgi:cytochrome c oxidase assembly protein subunit 16
LKTILPEARVTSSELALPPNFRELLVNTMPTFQANKYPTQAATRYRAAVRRHPFLLFGLPFITLMLAGSFFLTPATALRYEKHDKKVTQMSKEEALNVGKNKRKVDMKEEYYVRLPIPRRLQCRTIGYVLT